MKRTPTPTLVLPTGDADVPLYLRLGVLEDVASVARAHLKEGGAYVVTDSNVAPLYGERVAEALDAPFLVLPAGEEHKRWTAAERIVRWLLGAGAERRDMVVAVGGGVITDVAGFAASVTLRGLPWIAVPTTLLGMVDAAIGGKTGIDLDLGKNLVGTFWPPRAILADPEALHTLDERQLRAGLAEVVKAGMLAPSTLTHVLDAHLGRVASGDRSGVLDLVHAAVRIKGEVVAADAREVGARASLNLGHTLGHALEAATDYGRFLHGEAVAWGLLAALRLSRDRGLLSTAEAAAWVRRVGALAPLPTLDGLTWDRLAPYVARDKKRSAGAVGWVLPRDGGVVLGVTVSTLEVESMLGELRKLPPTGPFTALL